MHRVRSALIHQILPNGIARGRSSYTGGGASAALMTNSHYLCPNLSRSRPAPTDRTQALAFISRLPATAGRHLSTIRLFSTDRDLSDTDIQKKVEEISEKFKEAMELLDDARGSAGTVYFSEDMTDAENAIQEVLSDYDALLKQLNEDQKRSVVRTIGLKIEELKAQVEMLKDSLKE